MKHVYPVLFLTTMLSSCGLKIGYLGNTYTPTNKVDIYVDASTIRKPFDVVGKGYVESVVLGNYSVEKLQRKAIEMARKKGADAVLFQDYQVAQPATQISTTTRTDTVHKGIVISSSSEVSPVISSGRNILFLKYQ